MFLAEPLADLFYNCLTKAVVADDWKTKVICPIFKNWDPEDFANYRPLSLASVVCKGYEQIINRSFSQNYYSIEGQREHFGLDELTFC